MQCACTTLVRSCGMVENTRDLLLGTYWLVDVEIYSFLQPRGPQVAQTRALRHDHLEDKYRHRHPSLLGRPPCALNKALCRHFPARTSCSSVPAWKLFETNHKNMEFIEPAIFLACAERKGLCRETLLAALIERHAVGPIMARTTR